MTIEKYKAYVNKATEPFGEPIPKGLLQDKWRISNPEGIFTFRELSVIVACNYLLDTAPEDVGVANLTVQDPDTVIFDRFHLGRQFEFPQPKILRRENINSSNLQTIPDSNGSYHKLIWKSRL